LYGLEDNDYRYVFRDIISGSNAVAPAPGYKARWGWDACTGLGSIDGGRLLQVLEGQPIPQVPRFHITYKVLVAIAISIGILHDGGGHVTLPGGHGVPVGPGPGPVEEEAAYQTLLAGLLLEALSGSMPDPAARRDIEQILGPLVERAAEQVGYELPAGAV
jgi:hypothetical protein